MRPSQRVVYATKSLARFRIGRIANCVAKIAAGLYFDLFQRCYRTEGMSFIVPREQTTLSLRGKFAVDSYELTERSLVKRHLPRAATVLELGGCIGVLSCVINRRLDHPSAHVVVEANPKLIPVLERNRDSNGARFRIENGAISRRSSAKIAISRDMDSSTIGPFGLPVATMTLEQLEAKHGVVFDAIVMDIEGGETAFIDENIEKLRRIEFLMVEFHPAALGDATITRLRSVLRDAGLRKVDDMLATEVYARFP
jgi:FkbM family methyltransferase